MFENNGNMFDTSNFNNNNETTSFNNEIPASKSNDMPPELGEIRGLNDATKVNAPTLDVLGPMNLMPEKTLEPEDALTRYENGLPNTFEIPSLNNNEIDGNEEKFTSYFNRTLEKEESEEPVVPLINNEEETNYEIVNDIKINEEEASLVQEEINISESEKEPVIEETNEIEEESIVQEDIQEEVEETFLNENLELTEEEIEIDKVEVQKEEPSIVDDTKDELISDKILKIREYIDSLNLDVKIEEYDFEELYQLIIKINK